MRKWYGILTDSLKYSKYGKQFTIHANLFTHWEYFKGLATNIYKYHDLIWGVVLQLFHSYQSGAGGLLACFPARTEECDNICHTTAQFRSICHPM